MSQMIYVIDDEVSITDALQFSLEQEGFEVRVFHTGQAVVDELEQQNPSLLILDVGLSDGSGFDFFRQYREVSAVPVIFLTARSDEIDRVVGLEMGADDYISKPFSVRELIARVRVVLRREEAIKKQTASNFDNDSITYIEAEEANAVPIFVINDAAKKITYHNQLLSLTAHEYRLLQVLLSQPSRVFSRAQLLEHISDSPEHRLERTIDTHIKAIRLKLRNINDNEEPIVTHRGMGYSFEPQT